MNISLINSVDKSKNSLINPQISLANLTSFRVGGKAEWYTAPRNWSELEKIWEWYNKESLPLTIVGAGSNLLISDRGISGLVLNTRYWRHSHFDHEKTQITVAAGEPIAKVAWQAAKRGWKGLEWAVGIPGTVGGAVVMNAGAHGAATADCLVTTKIISPNGKIEILKNEDLAYQYRSSKLQNQNKLVLEATFKLESGWGKQEMLEITNNNLKMRTQSQPYDRPSCGSVFRNPPNYAAGWLIEQSGLKGYTIGDAQVAHRHANFILNCGHATAREIWQLINHIQATVAKNWNINLETEVQILGEF